MKTKLKKLKKLFYPSLAALFVLAATIFVLSKYQFNIQISKNIQSVKIADSTSLADMAKQVVADCSSVSYKPTCYEDKIPALMQKISMLDAFKVTQLVQQDDPSYTYCHVLGHKLASNEVAKDPSKWLDVVDMCPSGECSNGCIHGAFQERFRTESMTPDQIPAFIPQVQDVCEKRQGWDPTGLEQGTCYHALGHLLMYVTNADINASTKLCDQIALKDNGRRDFRKLCYDGNFMQLFQPLENEDKVLIAGKVPTKLQLALYCSKFSTMEELSCWDEGWPLYHDEIMTPSGVVKFCDHLSGTDRQNLCFTDLFYVVTAEVQLNTDFMKDYCAKLPTGVSANCFSNTASRLIETDYANIDKAVEVCKSAPKKTDIDECEKELAQYATFNFHPGSDQFNKMCNALDEPWRSQCLSGTNSGKS